MSAEGQRYDFGINEWKGNAAPAANLTVDVVVTNGRLSWAMPVNEAYLAKFPSVISAGGIIGIEFKLTNLLNYDMGMMGNGKGIFLVLLAAATIAVPYFWKHRFAPLAFLAPLLVTVMAFWPLYKQYQEQQRQMAAMGELGRMLALTICLSQPTTQERRDSWLATSRAH